METRDCVNCQKTFSVYSEDKDLYVKFGVPAPTFCPECRLIRRLTLRNERALYKRKCDLCGKDEILMFPQESPFTVYCFSCWWSDGWDGKAHAREYDFSRTFFEQFYDLLKAVPRPGKIQQGTCVNSVYTNRVSDLKNSYLSYGSNNSEDIMYSCRTDDTKNSLDCYDVHKSERCYECIDCVGCYNLSYSRESIECSSSTLLLNCKNCQDCFGCVNLRGKTHHIFNEPYTKDDYQKKVAELTGSADAFTQAKNMFEKLAADTFVPWAMVRQAANSSGNWLDGVKNIWNGFTVRNVEDGRYIFALVDCKDVMDYCQWGRGCERIYEGISVGRQCTNVKFASECWNQLRDSEYVMNCHNSHDLFGCIGLKNAEYCIFNKQYSKEEYESLVPKIKEQMDTLVYKDSRGVPYTYGNMFPAELSPFAYNETIAQEYFPKNSDSAKTWGSYWITPQTRNYGVTLLPEDLPKKIELVADAITKEIIGCKNKGKEESMCTTAFRITPDELTFYRQNAISLPHFCPNCRHFDRLALRTAMMQYHDSCDCVAENHGHNGKCTNEFETSYPKEYAGTVYCETCYQAEVV